MFHRQSILLFLLSAFFATIMASSDPSMILMDHMVPVTYSDDFDFPFESDYLDEYDFNNEYLNEEALNEDELDHYLNTLEN
jgi:hypothetical protein